MIKEGRFHFQKDGNNKDILTDATGQEQIIMEWEKFSKSKKLIFPTPYIDNLN